MPNESLPSPERKLEGKKPGMKGREKLKVQGSIIEDAHTKLLRLRDDIFFPLKKIQKNTVDFAKKYTPDSVKQFGETMRNNLQIERMSEAEFVEYLLQLDKNNKLNQFPTSKFVFKSELLEASQSLDPQEARKLVSDAKEKYLKCFANLLRMKARGTPREEIYMHLLTQQGGYRRSSSYVSELLVNGSGNCQARAKLMIMLLKDLYGDDIDVRLQLVNLQNSNTGKIEAHTRAVVKDKFGYYILEFPQIRYRTLQEGKDMDLYPESVLKKAYLRGKGVLPGASGKKFPVDPVNTNTFLSLPTTDKVENDQGERVSAQDAIALRSQLAKDNPSKSKKDEDDDLEIPRDVSDYVHMKILTDPDIAYDILEQVNGHSDELKLSGLVMMSEECAEIIATGFMGRMLRVGISSDGIRMTPGLATQLSKFSQSLELGLEGDLTPDVAAILAKPSPRGSKPSLAFFINGKLPTESAKILMQSKEGSMYGIVLSVRDGISLETAKVLNVPDRPIIFDDTGKMPFEVLQYFLHSMHPRANFTLRLTYTAPDALMQEYWKVNRPGFCLEMPDARVCVDTSSEEKGIYTLYTRTRMTKEYVRFIRPDTRQFAVHLSNSITPEAVSALCGMNKPFTLFSEKKLSLEKLQTAIGSRKIIDSDHDMGETSRYTPMRYRYDFE